ncbi:MAG: ribosomal-protein-alanine N-acetyltransferase [Nitrospira sp.]|nr:ribosomal-protein-alanine N-acetyltransferase [Nitrospira sp.]
MTQGQQAGSLLLQPAEVQDLDQLLRLEQESCPLPWTSTMFEAELRGNPFGHLSTVRLVDAAGRPSEIAGYICFWVVFEELRLMNLAVASPWRRQGLGMALVRHALSVGLEKGAGRAVLEVRGSNEAARKLYEGLGFVQTAVRTKYYTNPIEDALLMEMVPLLVG